MTIHGVTYLRSALIASSDGDWFGESLPEHGLDMMVYSRIHVELCVSVTAIGTEQSE